MLGNWVRYSVRLPGEQRVLMRVGGDMIQVQEERYLTIHVDGNALIKEIQEFQREIGNDDTGVTIETDVGYDRCNVLTISGWRAPTNEERLLLQKHLAEQAELEEFRKKKEIEHAKKLLKEEGLL